MGYARIDQPRSGSSRILVIHWIMNEDSEKRVLSPIVGKPRVTDSDLKLDSKMKIMPLPPLIVKRGGNE